MDNPVIEFILGSIILIMIFAPIISIPILFIVAINYNKKVTLTKPKQRFKYLDTFYAIYNRSNIKRSTDFYFVVMHIISLEESNKIYAIPESSFRYTSHRYWQGKFDIVKGSNIKNYVKVLFNDSGSVWIDREFPDYFRQENGLVSFGNIKRKFIYLNDDSNIPYSKLNGKLYVNLKNLNHNYDISLLEKSTYAYGVAEFDMDNHEEVIVEN